MWDQAASSSQLPAALTASYCISGSPLFKASQYLIVKTANPAHRKHSRQHPLPSPLEYACRIASWCQVWGARTMLPNSGAVLPWECCYRG